MLRMHRITSRPLKITHRRSKVARKIKLLVDPPSAGPVDQDSLRGLEAKAVVLAVAERGSVFDWAGMWASAR